MSKTLQVCGIVRESIVDGPGFRYTVFTQGCPHHCPGCHNPQTHPFEGGTPMSPEDIVKEAASNPLIKGITLSGGDPFCQAFACAETARLAHEAGLDVITYTGYTFEQLLSGASDENHWMDLLKETDVVIDGPFLEERKSLLLQFRGSDNQRILDCQKSVEQGVAVERDFS